MRRIFQPRPVPTVITLCLFAVLMAMGVWQLQRLEWKTALLQTITRQMKQAPETLPAHVDDPAAWNYRRVAVTGVFLHGRAMQLRPRVLDGKQGYHLVTPLRRDDGSIVLVNRGFVPDTGCDLSAPAGPVTVDGIAQLPHKSAFTPANDPAKNQWYWVDTRAMGADMPLVVAAAATPQGLCPVGGQLRVDIPNDHRQYAIFWFGMGGILLLVYAASQWKEDTDAALQKT
jgi:surfeit locus 1 family protein